MEKKGFIKSAFLIFFIMLIFSTAYFFCSVLIIKKDKLFTYKRKEIVKSIEELSINEYKLQIKAEENCGTIWISSKVPDLFTENEESYTEIAIDNIRLIMKVFGRIILSIDNRPEFYVLEIKEENSNKMLRITGNVFDTVQFQMGYLPSNEYSKRKIEEKNPLISKKNSIKMDYFVIKLLESEITKIFTNEKLTGYFEFHSLKVNFENNNYVISFDIKPLKKTTPHLILNQIIKVTYQIIIKNYNLANFDAVKFIDNFEKNEKIFSLKSLKELYVNKTN